MLCFWGPLFYRRSTRAVLALLALISIQSPPAVAAPVSPQMQVLVQPGGARIEARQWGDERMSGWETAAGLTILRDRASGNWVYAIRGGSGQLEPTNKIVGRDKPPQGAVPHLRPLNAKASARAMASLLPFGRRGDTPSLGTNNLLTILVNYADTQTTFSPEDFRKLLFGQGVKSMADYYAEMSYGKLTLKPGPAGVRGWYKINMTAAQVAKDYNKMAFQAVLAADRDGVDFSAYDMDGDCDADTVAIIHQGEDAPGYAGNLGNYGPYQTHSPCPNGGYITVHNYITLAERVGNSITNIGVFAHEYGHVLGLPDLYDIDGSSAGNGIWSNMAGGAYNCDWQVLNGVSQCVSSPGDTPPLFDPWSRMVLNWLTPIVIDVGAPPQRITLPPANESPNVVLFGSGQPNSEYFLVENRQRSGFDAGLPGSGLLVWHIDDAFFMNDQECATFLAGECALRHYKISLVPADGNWDLEMNKNSGDEGDPFPGNQGVTSIDDDTSPSVRFYSGAPSGIRISEISQNGKNVSALMSLDAYVSLRYIRNGSGRGKITVSPPGTPMGCDPIGCSAQFLRGTRVTLSATPRAGSVFTGWSGADCSGTGSCSVTLSSNQDIEANFEGPTPFTLVSYRGGDGDGRIVVSPPGWDRTCDAWGTCMEEHEPNSEVTLTAEPAAGSSFENWSVAINTEDGYKLIPLCEGTGNCTVSLSSSMYVMAQFRQKKLYSLAVRSDGSGAGSVQRSPVGPDETCSTDTGICETQYEDGTVVTLTATPRIGSVFTGWKGAGCAGTGSCSVTMSSAQAVDATFEELIPLVVSFGSGFGSVALSSGSTQENCIEYCQKEYAPGSIVTLTANPDPGSVFTGWSVSRWTGSKYEQDPVCNGTGSCTVTVSSYLYIRADFSVEPRRFSLVLSSAGTGAGNIMRSPLGIDKGCSPATRSCEAQFDDGTIIALSAVPSAGSVFAGWSGGGCSGTGDCTVTMSAAQSVTATFNLVPPKYALFLVRAGTGSGGVALSSAGSEQFCANSCSTAYEAGTVVTMNAKADQGSVFAGWSGGGCSGTGDCTVTMSAAQSVTATFKLVLPNYVLSFFRAGTGSGGVGLSSMGSEEFCANSCSKAYEAGTVVTMQAKADQGSIFAGWSGAGCSGMGTCTLAMSAAMAVTAKFDKLPVYILSYSKSGSGAGTVVFTPAGTVGSCAAKCSAGFAAGTEVTVTAIPAPGSAFSGWSGRAGCSGTGTCKLTMTKALALRASFKKLPTYALSYSKTGKGSGTVAFSPGGQKPVCASRCTNSYVSGTVVTLTAAAQPGSVFLGWSGNRSCSGTGPCTLTLSRAQSVKANFSPARTSSLPN